MASEADRVAEADLGHLDDGRGPDALVRPDDADLIAGVRPVEDKVDNLLARIEARENLQDSTDSSLWWYLTLIAAFFVGSLLSGAALPEGGDSVPQPVGMVDMTPLLNVLASGVMV
jgi:hypothetical protein